MKPASSVDEDIDELICSSLKGLSLSLSVDCFENTVDVSVKICKALHVNDTIGA